jgi:hypothetical protein
MIKTNLKMLYKQRSQIGKSRLHTSTSFWIGGGKSPKIIIQKSLQMIKRIF